MAHAGRELRINVLPWYRPVGVAIPPVSRTRRENRAARKGKLSPRGTETTVPRPSAPGCGDTLKAQASDKRLILGGDGPRRRLRVTCPSYSSARRRLNVQSGQRKDRKGAAAPYLSVAVRDRGH